MVKCSFCKNEIPANTREAGNRLYGMVACYGCTGNTLAAASEGAKDLHGKLCGKKEVPLHMIRQDGDTLPFPTHLAKIVRAIKEGFPEIHDVLEGTSLVFTSAAGWHMNCVQGSEKKDDKKPPK